MDDRFDFDALARELARGLSRREALCRLAGGFAGALLAALGLPRAAAADPGGNSACAHWCDNLPPSADTDHCKSDAAHGQGLCFQCGPAAPAGHPDLCSIAGLGATCCPSTAPNCCGGRCTNVLGDSSNCGFCGMGCAAGESCQNGQCIADCPTCSGACLPPRRRCGPVCCPLGGDCEVDTGPNGRLIYTCFCPADQCGNICVDFQTDASNCGACGVACAAGQSCVGGQCTCTSSAGCPAGQSCCGGVCINTSSDQHNCGACGHRCALFPVPQTCCNGACCAGTCCSGTCCPPGKSCCGGQCVDTSSDQNNCGTCGNACGGPAPFDEICCNGVCCLGSCCNGACCDNCCNGACCNSVCCNNVCCAAGQSCTNGTCVCPVDEFVCNGACVNPSQDPNNCGACGAACAAGQTCNQGRCTCQFGTQCPGGESCCSGICANLQNDPANCGRCFNRCGPNENRCCSGTCTAGVCGAG